eukprot:13654436-Alexandrium_andersonii.AAC.1
MWLWSEKLAACQKTQARATRCTTATLAATAHSTRSTTAVRLPPLASHGQPLTRCEPPLAAQSARTAARAPSRPTAAPKCTGPLGRARAPPPPSVPQRVWTP